MEKGTGDFKKDLELGHLAEDYVGNYLTNYKNCTVKKNPKKDYKGLCECDLYVTNAKGVMYKVEVKEDFMYPTTGNVCVEEKCMEHSESDFVMYRLGDEIYGIKRLKLINEMIKYRVAYKNNGDKLYLIPYSQFVNITKKIK